MQTPPTDRLPHVPTSFLSAPSFPGSGRGVGAAYAGAGEATGDGAGGGGGRLPRSVPTLTVYAGGPACFNAEASGLLAGAAAICARRPPAVRRGRTAQLWEVGPGECLDLLPHPDQLSQLRVRFPPGEAPAPGVYLLCAVASARERFTLYPLPA